MKKFEVGNVIETMGYYLITREDENFVYAREVKPYIELGDEFIIFSNANIEKEASSIGIKSIIDMNEVVKRYLQLT